MKQPIEYKRAPWCIDCFKGLREASVKYIPFEVLHAIPTRKAFSEYHLLLEFKSSKETGYAIWNNEIKRFIVTPEYTDFVMTVKDFCDKYQNITK